MREILVPILLVATTFFISNTWAAPSLKKLEALGFTSAAAWQAGPCELPSEWAQPCSFTALPSLRTRARAELGEDAFVPFALRCPKESTGTFDLLSKVDGLDFLERIRVVYVGGNAIEASVSTAERGQPLQNYFEFYFGQDDGTEEDLTKAKKVLGRSDILMRNICAQQ